MPLPINVITPALKLLSEKIDILPASGGAVEDLQRPDEDELEDMLLNRDSQQITDFAETPTPTVENLYRPTPSIFGQRNISIASLLTVVCAPTIWQLASREIAHFPSNWLQIGAAVMERDDKGKVHPLGIKNSILLLVPKGQFGVSDSVWAELGKLNTADGFFQVIDTTQRTANTPQEPNIENLRTRAGGIARNRMHKLEIEMIDRTDGRRDAGSWLILDGAVKLDEFIKTPHMIGVAKNFRKDPQFIFGKKHHQRKDITQIIAGLPYAYRTAGIFSCMVVSM